MSLRPAQLPVFNFRASRVLPFALLMLLSLAGLAPQRPLEAGSQFGRVDDWQVGQAGIVVREAVLRGLHPTAPTTDGGDTTDAATAAGRAEGLPRTRAGAASIFSHTVRLLAPAIRPQSPRAPPFLV